MSEDGAPWSASEITGQLFWRRGQDVPLTKEQAGEIMARHYASRSALTEMWSRINRIFIRDRTVDEGICLWQIAESDFKAFVDALTEH